MDDRGGKGRASAVPQVLAHDAALGAFAMTYFQPQDYPVWKEELRHGRVDAAFAARLGATMAAIHSATAGSAEVTRRFANDGCSTPSALPLS